MLRNIFGVVVGYLVMAIFLFIFFTGAYMAMGADGAFKPGSYDPSTLWIVASYTLGFLAALIGGVVCGLISRRAGAVIALIVVMFVLGWGEALMLVVSPPTPPGPREGTVSNFDAAMKAGAAKPVWMAVLNPVVGAIAAWIGGKLVLRNKTGAPAV